MSDNNIELQVDANVNLDVNADLNVYGELKGQYNITPEANHLNGDFVQNQVIYENNGEANIEVNPNVETYNNGDNEHNGHHLYNSDDKNIDLEKIDLEVEGVIAVKAESDQQIKPVEEKKEEEKPSVSFFKLQYAYTTKCEMFALVIATFLSIASGAAMPAFMLIFGQVINQFSIGTQVQLSAADFETNINTTCTYFVYIGIAMFCASAINLVLWSNHGKTLVRRIRSQYFKAIMRQEQNWFDQFKNKYEFATKIETQTKTIESGLGIKVGNFMMGIAMFIGKNYFLIIFSLYVCQFHYQLEDELSHGCNLSSPCWSCSSYAKSYYVKIS